jgi:hypothetical protein
MYGTSDEAMDQVSFWTVGLGIIIIALFPLAIPFIALTAIAVIPLAVPVLAIALAVALFAVPVLLIRGLRRRLAGRVSSVPGASPEPRPSPDSRPAQAWR